MLDLHEHFITKAVAIGAWVVIGKTAYNLMRMVVVLIWRRHSQGKSSTFTPLRNDISQDHGHSISILIPLYYEAVIASQIVATAYRLIHEAPANVRVILICSARERRLGTESTFHILQKLVNGTKYADQTHVIESDGLDLCKADQLNQGLEYLNSLNQASKGSTHWIGIYDADSAPEDGTITELLTRAVESDVVAFQQAPLYVGRWDRFNCRWSRLLVDLFCLSRALYSHIFAFKESFGFLLSGRALDGRLHHFTGHGYFIRHDRLIQLGKFSPPSCDTSLGYRVSLAGYKISLLKTYDISEVPSTFSDFMSQGLVWFNGCELYLREYRLAQETGTLEPSRSRTWFRIAQVMMTNASWSFLPLCWALWLSYSIISQYAIYLWVLAFLVWVGFRYLAWADLLYSTLEYRARIGAVRGVMVPLICGFVVLIGCIPPLWYYYAKLTGRLIKLKKTVR